MLIYYLSSPLYMVESSEAANKTLFPEYILKHRLRAYESL